MYRVSKKLAIKLPEHVRPNARERPGKQSFHACHRFMVERFDSLQLANHSNVGVSDSEANVDLEVLKIVRHLVGKMRVRVRMYNLLVDSSDLQGQSTQ